MIYLDNASTTRVDNRVLEEMIPYFTEKYGLPGGEFGHRFDEEAREAVEIARARIAKKINAKPDEIIFVSDETEADNLAIKGLAPKKPATSVIDRKSIIKTVEKLGGTKLKVNSIGRIDELSADIDLLATHVVNFEIGTVQDIKALIDESHDKNAVVYLDANHAFGKIELDVKKLGVDLMSFSSHLIYGPKGVTALYIRDGVKITPLFNGDFREFGLRPGMINVPSIVGFGKATDLLAEVNWKRIRKMKNALADELLSIKDARLNGSLDESLSAPDILNLSFLGAEGESLLLHLDLRDIIVSTGSACYSQELQPSHVIRGIGGSYEEAHGSIRFSFGKYNTEEEIPKVVNAMKDVVAKIRSISSGVV